MQVSPTSTTLTRRRRSSRSASQAVAQQAASQPHAATPHLKHMTGKQQIGVVQTQLGAEKTPSIEYDPFEAGEFVQGWFENTAGEFVPMAIEQFAEWFPEEKYGVFKGPYGNEVRKRAAIWAVSTGASILSAPIANMVRSTLHGALPNLVGEPTDGPMFQIPPANELAASLIKTASVGVAKKFVTSAWAPKTVGGTPAPPPPPGPQFLGKDLTALAKDSLSVGLSYAISKVYDQTVGPVVLKQINSIMGKGDAEIPKPKPMTPGGVASSLASAFMAGLLMRPVEFKPVGAAGAAGGMGAVLGQAAINGLISSAFDTVYSRSLGPAINDAVNGMAGIPASERKPASMPAERLARTVARGAVSGGAYYAVDALSQGWFGAIGASMGGGLGGLVAMAGPAVAGMVAGTVVDAVAGEAVGKLAGSLWSAVTGKPMAEDRPQAPTKPKEEEAPAGAAPAAPAAAASAPAQSATVTPAPTPTAGPAKKKAKKGPAPTPQQLAAAAVAAAPAPAA